MKLISIAFLLIFVFFIGNSIYNLIIIFQVPVCTKNDVCYKSYLNSKPNLALLLFYSNKITPRKYDLIFKDPQFDYKQPVEKIITINLSEADRNNASLLIHTVLLPTKHLKDVLELRELVDSPSSTYMKKSLTKYAIPVSTTFSLLTDGPNVTKTKPVSHIRSKFGLVMCADELLIPQMKIPPEFMRLLRFDGKKQFLPLLHIDNMQIKDRDLVEISEAAGSVNFTLYYNPISFGKLRFLLQVEEVLKQFRTLGFTDKDLDDVKSVFADTNLYLLCLTVFISSVHLLLDFLSFKNDISFWRNHKSMAGLSTTAILWRAFAQIVIFLYLLDEGTSLIVLIPSGVGAVIEIWKVLKTFKGSFSFTSFQFVKEKTETDAEAKTRQYDEECMKKLSYLLYPLCLSAALYSLIYQSHKSWYSWFINSLVNGVYAFGFLFMLPQLFINYKLKSVAALPWRVFTYKAFNTFIDDVFAFIITMPTAHRVACFRDDIVFFIYLYQRWLYPIDKSRVDTIDFQITETVEKKES